MDNFVGLDAMARGPWLEIHRVRLKLSWQLLQLTRHSVLLRLFWTDSIPMARQSTSPSYPLEWAKWDMLTALANYHSVVKILLRYLTTEESPRHFMPEEVSDRLTRDISSVSAQITSILSDSAASKRFLSCRGALAQQLLDLLQDLLDSSYEPASRPLLSKALLKLSGECGLHPTCFALDGLERLGQQVAGGGYGDIWRGRVGGQIVAVKSMRQFQDDDVRASLKKFGREALIWRQLSHPNLLPFFGLYTLDSRLCLISPWMDNGDLKSFLGRAPPGIDHLSLVVDIAMGLEYLHSQNIVHGDLKTANILVTPSRRACIADFGLSSIVGVLSLNTTLSSRSGRPGTVRYQAPEILLDQRPNHFGSDVYAFACLTYEILSGNPPFFDIHNEVAIILKVVEGIRPSRSEKISPLRLWQLLDEGWSGRPEDRPTMTSILQRLLMEPIVAQVKESQPDWDETYSARFRRSVQDWPLLPSVQAIERSIFRRTADPADSFSGIDLDPPRHLHPPAPLTSVDPLTYEDMPNLDGLTLSDTYTPRRDTSTLALGARPSAPLMRHAVLLPPWMPPGSPDPRTLHFHPWLDGNTPSPIFHVDFALKTFTPLRLGHGNTWIRSTSEQFTDSAFHPPLTALRILHPRIPFWPVDLKLAPGMAADSIPPISVGDVLWELYKTLQTRITHTDWALLDQDEQAAVTHAYQVRCRGEAVLGSRVKLREREIEARNDWC
ncbi:kinase-like domain-containing protein [Mycena metata]|uniref:Kinase-like domain-containing protein n=1 Tax=Mycena metata TaxID=1033252 RepID=A0AAD7N1L0_9AGAR|nr:kinase-like domain-containing protein [Mycena metata]